jgi:uncharacterized protein YukE
VEFNEEQYRAAIAKIRNGLVELNAKVQQFPIAAAAAANNPSIPESVRQAIVAVARRASELFSAMINKIVELLAGAAAPIMFFRYAYQWQDVRGTAGGVVGTLRPDALAVSRYWRGEASDAYGRAIKPQSDAATKLVSIAERTATALNVCAAAGMAFYVAIGVIVVKLIIAAAAIIAAFGSVAFSWAGLLLIVEEAGVNTAAIIAAVASLTALLGAQASQMSVLHGEAVDTSTFPGGSWPRSASDTFSDATVLDGDAKWSVLHP